MRHCSRLPAGTTRAQALAMLTDHEFFLSCDPHLDRYEHIGPAAVSPGDRPTSVPGAVGAPMCAPSPAATSSEADGAGRPMSTSRPPSRPKSGTGLVALPAPITPESAAGSAMPPGPTPSGSRPGSAMPQARTTSESEDGSAMPSALTTFESEPGSAISPAPTTSESEARPAAPVSQTTPESAPGPPPAARYRVTDIVHAVPAGIWDTSVVSTYEFTNLADGVFVHVRSPLSIVMDTHWEIREAVHGGGQALGLELVEDVTIRCSRLLVGIVRAQCEAGWSKIHGRMIARLEREVREREG